MNTTDLLHRVAEVIDPESARGTNAVIQYQLTEPVHHVFEDGKVSSVTGTHAAPDVTVVISDANIRRLLNGELKLGPAVFTGKLRVKGDLLLAQKLLGLVLNLLTLRVPMIGTSNVYLV